MFESNILDAEDDHIRGTYNQDVAEFLAQDPCLEGSRSSTTGGMSFGKAGK